MSEQLEEFLEHHGIKGMRWGVRRKKTSKGTVEPSADAKRASEIRAKAKSGTVKSLSNQEIRDFTTRVQLEGQFHSATPSNAKKTLNFVKELLGVGHTVNQVAAFSNSPTGQKISSGLKKPKKFEPKIVK